MKLGIAQLNLTVGDIDGNSAMLLQAARDAHAAGAALLLTPEMSICGYPAEDLVLRRDFTEACEHALLALALAAPPELALIVGFPERTEHDLFNAAALLRNGQVEAVYRKHHLPNHSVFDEKRIFNSGYAACTFMCGGVRFGLNICGDIWDHAAPSILVEEAGGRFTDHWGGKRLDTRTAIYSNGIRHDDVLDAISQSQQSTAERVPQ